MVFLRSLLFAVLQVIVTCVFGVLVLLSFPVDPIRRHWVIRGWSWSMIWLAEKVLGIRYRVLGAERIPPGALIVMSKHQSAWETMLYNLLFQPAVYVLKRELLWIPFFGWGLWLSRAIAIDRKAGTEALRQTLAQGRDRLAKGFRIIIFPEGTRVKPGERGKYQVGGAWLAVQAGAPVVPVAHNAGDLWGRGAFVIHAGMVTVSVGTPIDPKGMKAQQLSQRVEDWIETEMGRIGRARREAE